MFRQLVLAIPLMLFACKKEEPMAPPPDLAPSFATSPKPAPPAEPVKAYDQNGEEIEVDPSECPSEPITEGDKTLYAKCNCDDLDLTELRESLTELGMALKTKNCADPKQNMGRPYCACTLTIDWAKIPDTKGDCEEIASKTNDVVQTASDGRATMKLARTCPARD